MPRYLEKRRRRWYAKLDIPKALRPALGGKPRYVESLKTESLTEAERLAPILVARWKAELDAVRSGSPVPTSGTREKAMAWREALDKAKPDEREAIELVLSDQAEKVEEANSGAGRAFYKIATRQWQETSEHVEEWLATLDNEPKTVDMKRADLARFAARFRVTRKVNRKAVQKWVYELQHVEGLSLSTIRRIVSACRVYWKHLQRLDIVPDDTAPFLDVVPKRKRGSKRTLASKRKPFTPHEVVNILNAALHKGDLPLARLIWLGMWTGCRIEELCSLKVDHAQGGLLRITDAKSEAGWREVPAHSMLSPGLAWLCSNSSDGFVLSDLGWNKYDDRSNAVGKRFGKLKLKLGFGRQHVFHSLRHTVTTQLDGAMVPEAVTARIVGHEIQTMTYGVYSSGAPLHVKRDAIEHLRYPLETFDTALLFPPHRNK